MKGQNTKSIRSKSLNNTRLPVVGSKSIVFFHQANANEQYIDITNLVTPSNTVNPSPSELAKARLKDFETNFELISSANGSLMNLAYEVVSNTIIKLKYLAAQGEIFEGRLHNYVTNGTLIADVRTPSASGELLENQRDYNLGEAILIKDLTNQWPIQVFRGATGTPMLRNIGNATFVSDQTIGNYEMLDRGDGYCQVIRFNIAGDVGNEPIMWASHGALGERPNLSVLQRVDKLNGVIDRLRQDALVDFGYDVSDPTRYDGGVPTQSDLKAFGDKVLALENNKINTSDLLAYLDASIIFTKYTQDSSQVIQNATTTTVAYNLKVEDTLSSYNPTTGVYTVPKNGLYTYKASVAYTAQLTGSDIELMMYINGIVDDSNLITASSQYVNSRISGQVRLKKDDLVEFKVYQDTGGTATIFPLLKFSTFSMKLEH